MNIAFLASGGGGNMKFFSLAKKRKLIFFDRITVIADRQCASLDYARNNLLEGHLIDYKKENSRALIELLENQRPDVVVTNWHKILGSDVVSSFEGILVNLHYSLLPLFPGLIGIEPIKQAFNCGHAHIGPTCHLVDEGVDTGRVLAQHAFLTPPVFSDAVTQMFQFGCVTLLEGIEVLTKTSLTKKKMNFSEKFDLFDAEFWKDLSQT